MQEFPCPHCGEVFDDLENLYHHALRDHTLEQLSNIIGAHMPVTKKDFVQVDSCWVYVYKGFQFTLQQNALGNFDLQVFGSVSPIPPATQYPSEPEWSRAEQLTNKFIAAYDTALEEDRRN